MRTAEREHTTKKRQEETVSAVSKSKKTEQTEQRAASPHALYREARLQDLTARADYFSILSVMLDYLTLPEVYEGIKNGSLQNDMRAIVEETGIADTRIDAALKNLTVVRERIAAGAFEYTHLRQEYTRLFNDPKKPAIGFYEGTFINKKYEAAGSPPPDNSTLFINQAALDADRQYKRAGVQRDIAKQNIPGDCMLTEMAFMQHLLQLKARAVLEGNAEQEAKLDEWLCEFKRLHLKVWMYDFFEKCLEISTQEYFWALGLLGQALAEETLRDMAASKERDAR